MATFRFSSSSAVMHNSIDFSSSQDLPAATIFSPKSVLFLPKYSTAICPEPSKSWKWKTKVSLISSFWAKNRECKSLKQELLEAIAPLDRGAAATPEDQQRVELIAQKLEAVNKVKEPLKSSLLNGKWELLYTTSKSILQNDKPKFLRPNGKIYQAINVGTLRAQNMETWPFFNQFCRLQLIWFP